jgi:signal transduction histidine kinase
VLRTRLLRSSTFRLTVAYLLVFGLSALALLAFVYGLAIGYMERQTLETIDAEIQGLVEQGQAQGLAGVARVIERRSENDPDRLGLYLLVDWAGQSVAGNLPLWPSGAVQPDGTLRFDITVRRDDGQLLERQAVARVLIVNQQFRLLVGRDVSEKWRTQQLLWTSILVGAGVMLVLGLGGGLILSRWTLGRLEHINRTTGAIMAGHLDRRIEVEGGGDEFDELALNLNAMLERIQRLLQGMREVTDNIAHDLRTPLTRIRSRIEVALLRDLDPAQTHDLLEATVKDAEGLIETFNALLAIARAEAGAQRGEWERLDLADLARDVAELYEPLAEEKHVRFELDAGAPVGVIGNRQLVAQALANLIDNAIKYTPEGGHVRVAVLDAPPRLVVRDDGPGIPPELRAKALERFVRLDPGRTSPGNGLGLSLVAAVARLHEAGLELDDAGPGLLVTLAFRPAPPPKLAQPETAVSAVTPAAG